MKTAFLPQAFQNNAFQVVTAQQGFTALIPYYISFEEWANQLIASCPSQDIPLRVNKNDWKSFANQLQLMSAFNQYFIPNPIGFNDWREWASQFLLSIGA